MKAGDLDKEMYVTVSTKTTQSLTKSRSLEVFCNDLNSVIDDTGPAVDPRARFHHKFQREVEEHDQDLDKKYDEDLNTALILVSAALSVGLKEISVV